MQLSFSRTSLIYHRNVYQSGLSTTPVSLFRVSGLMDLVRIYLGSVYLWDKRRAAVTHQICLWILFVLRNDSNAVVIMSLRSTWLESSSARVSISAMTNALSITSRVAKRKMWVAKRILWGCQQRKLSRTKKVQGMSQFVTFKPLRCLLACQNFLRWEDRNFLRPFWYLTKETMTSRIAETGFLSAARAKEAGFCGVTFRKE